MYAKCPKCQGTGTYIHGKEGMICAYCDGTGTIRIGLQCSALSNFICPYKYEAECRAPVGKIVCRYQMEVIFKSHTS